MTFKKRSRLYRELRARITHLEGELQARTLEHRRANLELWDMLLKVSQAANSTADVVSAHDTTLAATAQLIEQTAQALYLHLEGSDKHESDEKNRRGNAVHSKRDLVVGSTYTLEMDKKKQN